MSDFLQQLFGLQDRVAVVVGGTGILGGEFCHGLANAGATVVVAGRSTERGEERVESIENAGGKASFCSVDAADRASMESLLSDTLTRHGRVDILVNSAGV